MRTDDLVTALSRDPAPVDPAAVERRFGGKLVAAAGASLVLMVLWLGLRPDLAAVVALPMFWVKLLYPCLTAAAAWVLLYRLGHPGRRLGAWPAALALPTLALWALGAVVLLGAPAADRVPMLLGQTWRECPWNIALLSVPAAVLAVSATRALAPARQGITGAAAGAFAGAVAAAAYALHCPEMEAPFLAVWYVLGMALPALAGALLGRRLLHW